MDSNLGWAVTQSPRVKTTDETRLMRGRRGFRVKSSAPQCQWRSLAQEERRTSSGARMTARDSRGVPVPWTERAKELLLTQFRRYVQG